MEPYKVGVIVDWPRSARANNWPALLACLPNEPEPQVTVYPIAQLMVEPVSEANPTSLHKINEQEVLIVNWDAANGDPDFGAHLALQWFRHRRPELLHWVAAGKVLIIESQATFGVPSQDAYDAIAGPGELPVSGLEDVTNMLSFRRRLGPSCLKTKRFPTRHGFEDVFDPIEIGKFFGDPNEQFPKTATRLLTEPLKDVEESRILYRGWFRHPITGRANLPWVPLVTTSSNRMFGRHPVLQVARYGDGAIFASTMLLARTGQARLVTAMLRCARKNNEHLPKPESRMDRFQSSWKFLLNAFSGAIVGLAAGQTGWVTHMAKKLGYSDQSNIDLILKVLLVPAGVGAFVVARWGCAFTWKRARAYLGY